MNRTVKRYLMGLIASATMFGTARAQDDGPVGAVQLGTQAQVPVQSPAVAPQATDVQSNVPLPPGAQGFPTPPMPPMVGMSQIGQPGSPGYGNYFSTTPVDTVIQPRFIVSSYGGGLYGYNAGYANVGAFIPYKIDDNTILFATGMGMATYDDKGGGTVGGGWRYYMENLDRIVGLSAFGDFDNGHYQPYQQVGFSFESLGRYIDYRVNGYVPTGNPNHVLATNLTTTSALIGNGIGLLRNNTVEQSYSGFDAELGGPTPFLGRYGLNAYIGGYNFSGNGTHGGNFQGVSGRLLSQINEDLSFGVQVTNDHVFGLNTQFQIFAALPSGRPSRWLRNLRVQDRMVQNVFRQNRVIAHTDSFTSYDTAINPNTHQAYFVANINPNLTVNGNGSASSPFDSIANYEAVSVAQQKRYDIILVQPRADNTSTNLDTGPTLNIYNGQKLLSTAVSETLLTANLPNTPINLPGFTGGANAILVNSSGGNVVTLIGGNTLGQQVSGFQINGSLTGNGIYGNNNYGTVISQDTIQGSLNGVLLTNLTGTIAANAYTAAGSEAQIVKNTITGNYGNGIEITNKGAPPFVPPLDVVVQGNTFSSNGVVTFAKGTSPTAAQAAEIAVLGGTITTNPLTNVTTVTVANSDGLQLNAQAGSTIGGIIGGPNTTASAGTPAVTLSNTFTTNTGNGLNLTANGGILNFMTTTAPTTTTPPPFGVANNAFGIFNNTFTSNGNNGLNINTTNNSISSFNITQNTFGIAADSVVNTQFGLVGASTGANANFGIGLATDSGTTTINIGGATSLNADGTTFNPGNSFYANNTSTLTPGNAIDFAATGTAALTYNITNNTILNTYTNNAPPPVDTFAFSMSAASATTDLLTLLNASTPSTSGIGGTAVITGMTLNLSQSSASLAATGANNVVIQPVGNGFLTSVNNVGVQGGQTPLTLTGAGARLANDQNLNLVGGSQILPLGFNNNLTTGNTFTATSAINGPLGALATPAQLLGAKVTVTFETLSNTGAIIDRETATGTLNTVTTVNGVTTATISPNPSANGPLVPGYGTGSDGIHVAASGSAMVNSSTIELNSITGVAGYGIHVTTAGSANAQDVVIANNTLQFDGTGATKNAVTGFATSVFTGGGISLEQNGMAASNLDVLLLSNTINSNFNNGISVSASGAGNILVNSDTNSVFDTTLGSTATPPPASTGNAGNGLAISTSGSSVLTFNSTRDNFSGNGIGATQNSTATGGDNIAITTGGTSVANVNIYGVTSTNAKGNGLSGTTNNSSTLNLLVDNSTTSAGTVSSTFNNNVLSGIQLSGNDTSLLHAGIYNAFLDTNVVNGLSFNRTGASLILANIANTSMSSNGLNGVSFLGLGGDPTDPNQPFSGQANTVNLINDTINTNGTAGTGDGDGVYVSLFGQSVMVLNATSTAFENNVANGVEIVLQPGAGFGYSGGNVASTFDAVTITGNGANGIMFSSYSSASPLTQAGDPLSTTDFTLNSVLGNSIISNNGANGILAQYQNGTHTITINGDLNTNPVYGTFIQANGQNGILEQIGSYATSTLNVVGDTGGNDILIGGPAAANSNQGDGISFQPTSYFTIQQYQTPSSTSFTYRDFGAGVGIINVSNTMIQNNVGNGITLMPDGLSAAFGTATNYLGVVVPYISDGGFGQLNASVTNSTIINNGLNGINVDMIGSLTNNSLNFTGNTINSNGNSGFYMQTNAGEQLRNLATGALFVEEQFLNPATNPATIPLNPNNYANLGGNTAIWNTGLNVNNVLGSFFFSNWMNVTNDQNTSLQMYGNAIQYNGTKSGNAAQLADNNLNPSYIQKTYTYDGVHISVGTDTYLAADIGGPAGNPAMGNTISGNVHTDVYFNSFLSYNPATGQAPVPGTTTNMAQTFVSPATASVNAGSNALSTVFLDDTASLDLRFNNNVGNTVTAISPFPLFANVQGGAIYPTDPIKDDNFNIGSKGNDGAERLTQLFEVDNGNNINSTNLFISNGVTQNLSNTFLNASWYLRTIADPAYPNPLFPQAYSTNPPASQGDPFLP